MKTIKTIVSVILITALLGGALCVPAFAAGSVSVSVDGGAKMLQGIGYTQSYGLDEFPMVSVHEAVRAIGGSAYVFPDKVQIVIGSKLLVMGQVSGRVTVTVYNIGAYGNLDNGYDIPNPVPIDVAINGNDAYVPIESVTRALGIDSYCSYRPGVYNLVTSSCINDFGEIVNVSDAMYRDTMTRFAARLVNNRGTYEFVDLNDSSVRVTVRSVSSDIDYWYNVLGASVPEDMQVVVTGIVQNGTIALNTSTTSVVEYGKIAGLQPEYALQTESTNNTVDYSDANEVTVLFNGRVIDTGGVPAIEVGGRTYLPMRAILDTVLCGIDAVSDTSDRIGWIDAEQTAIATSTTNGKTLWVKIGENYIETSSGATRRFLITNSVNGEVRTQIRGELRNTVSGDVTMSNIIRERIEIDAPAFLYQDSYTMLPVRAVAETLDCGVDWNESTQTVNISYPYS